MNAANTKPVPSFVAYVPAYPQSLKTARISVKNTLRQSEK